ncbi:MAG: hypothetical protein ACPGWR_27440 [Ardenticatenaceae bacterium]
MLLITSKVGGLARGGDRRRAGLPFLLIMWLLLSGCGWGSPAPPPSEVVEVIEELRDEGEGLRVWSAGEVRAERDGLRDEVVTLLGVVTSVEAEWVTVQSGGGGVLVAGNGGRIAQEVMVTGRVGEVAGNLALLDVQEWVVEQEQVPFPEPAALTLTADQESLYVQTGGGMVDQGQWLNLTDGRRIAVRGLNGDIEQRLSGATRVDTVRGVLRQTPTGWVLLPPLLRDVVVAPPFATICQIQGPDNRSPERGERVETQGVVVAAWQEQEANALFLQMRDCDGEPGTSDGLFVRLAEQAQPPVMGDQVRLRGTVSEFYGRTQLDVEAGDLLIEAQGQPLPAPIPLAPPVHPNQAEDQGPTYYETLEGMLVTLNEAVVVGPTSRFGEFAIIPANIATANGHLFRHDAPATEAIILVGESGLFAPYDVAVGERISGLVGVLDYTFGQYKLQLIAEPTISAHPRPDTFESPVLGAGEWSIATFNAENLFDSQDEQGKKEEDSTLSPEALAVKLEKIATTIAAPLGLPTIVALQEVENLAVLEQLAAHPRLAGHYEAHLLEGHDVRGIDQGLLVSHQRVEVLESALAVTCSPIAAPGGSEEGDCPPGERLLFARPPLVAHLRLDGTRELYLINNHFKSKSGGEQETEPRRIAQAAFLANLIQQLQLAQPETDILVVGDLNDDEQSKTLNTLIQGTSLTNLWDSVPQNQARYAYIFVGVSQILDHILVTPELQNTLVTFQPLHLNADYPHTLHQNPTTPLRTSDHDPLLAIFR